MRATVMICAPIAKNPPEKQKAIAAHNAASVSGGSAVLFRSGQGRCNRPDVAVIFAASQRLSVSIIVMTMVAAAGAIVTSASSKRSVGLMPVDSRTCAHAERIVWVTEGPSELIAISATVIIIAAKITIQSRIRPTG